MMKRHLACEWARRGETGRQFVQGIDTPVQNYLVDVNLKAEGTEIEPNDLMDTFLLWSHYQLSAEYSPKNAKRVLDALRQLSEKQVYSGRQWNMIISLYETFNYSEEDKQEAIKFYLVLSPRKNKAALKSRRKTFDLWGYNKVREGMLEHQCGYFIAGCSSSSLFSGSESQDYSDYSVDTASDMAADTEEDSVSPVACACRYFSR